MSAQVTQLRITLAAFGHALKRLRDFRFRFGARLHRFFIRVELAAKAFVAKHGVEIFEHGLGRNRIARNETHVKLLAIFPIHRNHAEVLFECLILRGNIAQAPGEPRFAHAAFGIEQEDERRFVRRISKLALEFRERARLALQCAQSFAEALLLVNATEKNIVFVDYECGCHHGTPIWFGNVIVRQR